MSEEKTGPVTLDNAEVGDKVHCTIQQRNGKVKELILDQSRLWPIEVVFDDRTIDSYQKDGAYISSQPRLFHGHNPDYPPTEV